MRASVVIFAALLNCCIAGIGQANEPRNHVLARASDPSVRTTSVPQLAMVRLERRARWAAAVAPGSEMQLRVPKGARAIAFSIGIRTKPDAKSGLRFRVQHTRKGQSETLFEKTLGGKDPGWQNFEVPLPETALGSGDGFAVLSVDRVRRQTVAKEADASSDPPPARGWFGSILFLGPERIGAPSDLAAGRSRPNVILISLDTLGAAYIGDRDPSYDLTPWIDHFSSQGFSFERALASYPATMPSHSSIFSGLHPRHHGRYKGAQAKLASQVAALSRSGYFTAAITENAFVGSTGGFSAGFDWYDDGEAETIQAVSGNAAKTFPKAFEWLARHGHERRFFLFLHTYEVHAPYVTKNPAMRRVLKEISPNDQRRISSAVMSKMILAHNVRGRKLRQRDIALFEALHRTEVFNLDVIFGRLMKQLHAIGLAQDTLVIVTSDHGELFGEHGRMGHGVSLHNKALHVPLIFRLPGVVVRGSSADPIELVDILPTILELVGEPIPPDLDGRSLAPLILGKGSIEPRPAFSEVIYDPGACGEEHRGCRVDRYSVQTERFKLVTSKRPEFERLFDLEKDPAEKVDVSARFPDELARHRAYLEAYIAEQVDPEAAEASAKQQGIEVDPDTEQLLEALGYIE